MPPIRTKHVCDVDGCDKAFRRPSALACHKRTHTGERPHACDRCDAAFATSSNLTVHKRTHTGERPHACDTCDAAFAESSKLTVHKRTHTGERPFTCDTCDAAFAESGHLAVHNRIHTGERPFACNTCDKVFVTSGDRNRHVLFVHERFVPYKCMVDDCDDGFTSLDALRSHTRRTHHALDCTTCCTQNLVDGKCHQCTLIRRQSLHERGLLVVFKHVFGNSIAFQLQKCINTDAGSAAILGHLPGAVHGTEYRRFLDMVVEFDHVSLYVEVDEYQHSREAIECEWNRMFNIDIVTRLEDDVTRKPIVFLRWNPHNYRVDGTLYQTPISERALRLAGVIDHFRSHTPTRDMTIMYFYYSETGGVPNVVREYANRLPDENMACFVPPPPTVGHSHVGTLPAMFDKTLRDEARLHEKLIDMYNSA